MMITDSLKYMNKTFRNLLSGQTGVSGFKENEFGLKFQKLVGVHSNTRRILMLLMPQYPGTKSMLLLSLYIDLLLIWNELFQG